MRTETIATLKKLQGEIIEIVEKEHAENPNSAVAVILLVDAGDRVLQAISGKISDLSLLVAESYNDGDKMRIVYDLGVGVAKSNKE